MYRIPSNPSKPLQRSPERRFGSFVLSLLCMVFILLSPVAVIAGLIDKDDLLAPVIAAGLVGTLCAWRA